MAITYQTEPFLSVIAEAEPLIRAHWEEIARNKDTIPLNIDRIAYAKMDQRGQLLICTARDNGQIIGYAVYFILPHGHVHYRGTPWAESDIFWLAPDCRGHRIGLELFQFTEKMLAERGVRVMHTRSKDEHPAAARLLEGLGHVRIESVYAKVLGA